MGSGLPTSWPACALGSGRPKRGVRFQGPEIGRRTEDQAAEAANRFLLLTCATAAFLESLTCLVIWPKEVLIMRQPWRAVSGFAMGSPASAG